MGAGQSLLNKSAVDVFKPELNDLNNLVTNMITSKNKFINPDYNFLFEGVCSKYTVIWDKELSKHLKVDLENLSGSIYLVPKNDKITEEITKESLCNKISKHYVKVLYILSLVKTVYDLEHAGDNSIAGIMQRNVNIVNNIMELHFCSIPHKQYNKQPSDKIDFENLQGFKMFVEHFLTPIERRAFLDQFKSVFARKPRHKIVDAICSDSLVPLDMYEKMYAERFGKTDKKIKCKPQTEIKEDGTVNKKKERKTVDLMFEIVADNPVLHTNYCMSHKKYIIPLDNSNNDATHVLKVYNDMHKHYTENVDGVLSILYKIIEKESESKYKLKNISSDELQEIVNEVKQKIVIFYIQSIVDYQELLDVAKEIPNIQATA